MGRKELGYTEAEIWESTPRKFYSLLQCAQQYKQMSKGRALEASPQNVQEGFIDQIPGW